MFGSAQPVWRRVDRDSGGPLVVMRGGAPVQIGVVSWGAGSTYDVYMKVAGHRAWIESVIEG